MDALQPDLDRSAGTIPERTWLLLAVAVLPVLATYLWLTSYAYPTSDDWIQATNGREHGVWTSVCSYWQTTGGRWFMAVLVYGLGWCPDLPAWYPFLSILTLLTFLAAAAILANAFGLRRPKPFLIGTAILAVVQIVALPVLDVGDLGPHVATPETIYWLSGAWPFAGAYPLLMAAAWCCIRACPTWLAWTVCILVGALASGLSEMAGVAGVVLGVGLGCTGLRRGWILAAAAAVGFAIAAASPGNLHRLELLRQEVNADAGLTRLPAAMLAATGFTLTHLRDWLLNPAVAAVATVLAWWSASLPAEAAPWRKRFWLCCAATVTGVWSLALLPLTLVGFLEARHEGLVSLAGVAGILGTAWLAGRAWPRLRSPAGVRIAVAWLALSAVTRLLFRSPISPPGAGPWLDIAACVVMAVVLTLWLRGWRNAGAACLALGLLWQPAWWQAISDGLGKAPVLIAKVRARDQTVRTLVATGRHELALPWLGEPGEQPRTLRLYEVQDGWMADGYAGYFGLTRIVLSDRISVPMPLRPRRAVPVPPAMTPTP